MGFDGRPVGELGEGFDLGEILDRKGEGLAAPVFISEHPDQLLSTGRGYGKAKKPEDYLNEFTFRFNRRKSAWRGKLFFRLAQQAVQIEPVPYADLIKHYIL